MGFLDELALLRSSEHCTPWLTAVEVAGGLGVSSSAGHVLGMPHDDSKLCTRLFGPLDKHHMMAPLYVQLNKTRPWSPCSASFLREFLDRGYGRSPASPWPAVGTRIPGPWVW